MAGYTWTEYDAREGGIQVIKDPRNNVQVTTEFLKFPGGEHGGSWAARIKGEPMDTCACHLLLQLSRLNLFSSIAFKDVIYLLFGN